MIHQFVIWRHATSIASGPGAALRLPRDPPEPHGRTPGPAATDPPRPAPDPHANVTAARDKDPAPGVDTLYQARCYPCLDPFRNREPPSVNLPNLSCKTRRDGAMVSAVFFTTGLVLILCGRYLAPQQLFLPQILQSVGWLLLPFAPIVLVSSLRGGARTEGR